MRNTDFVVTLFEGKSNPNNLTVAVVMGLNALRQGHTATIILMVEAVELGRPGATKGIDIGAPFAEVSGQLEEFLELGGQVCICNACMLHNGFSAKDMDSRFELINAPDVVTLLMNAKGSLQIT
ncbi:DsrE family protein [Lawsonibacter celer]|jgi:tRNA 2-thiouridine synthesizing protein D|uniref:DsrE family protein n=1 Tax=Lawsonibacter celer TaxID=2986526 RepID=UPI001647E5CC|nr:DsrE family protein [Lawsonibacter celer]